jgi:hypothetical protein
MISIVVVSIVFERIVTFMKIRSILSLNLSHLYLLREIAKTALAAFVAGIFLFTFYWFTKDMLLASCVSFAGNILTSVNLEKFADFLGGSIYLGMCFAVFMPIYAFLANWFDLVSDEEKGLLKNLLRKPLALISKK